MRFYTASFGSNFDFETWFLAHDIIKKGESVYSLPDSAPWGRFNWGPIWPYALYIIKFISGEDRLVFHYLTTLLLTLVDLGLCYLFYKMYGKLVPILYFLSPLTYLISGFHLQFENISLLFAFLGWYLYQKNQKKYFYHSAVLFGLSLTAKHILILFPLWLFFYEYFKNKSITLFENIRHKVISYLIFISSFVLEIITHFSDRKIVLDGIIKYVIQYNSFDGLSAFGHLLRFIQQTDFYQFINFFLPINLLIGFLPQGVSYYRLIFLIVLMISGFFVAKNIQQKTLLFPLYLLFFFSFGSSLADQYFVIPLLTVILFFERIEGIVFHIISGTYLATFSLNNIASISNINHFKLSDSQIPIFPYNLKTIFSIDPTTQRFDSNAYSNYYIPQFYLLLMSCLFLYQIINKKELKLSPNGKYSNYILLTYSLFYFYIILIIILRKVVIDSNI